MASGEAQSIETQCCLHSEVRELGHGGGVSILVSWDTSKCCGPRGPCYHRGYPFLSQAQILSLPAETCLCYPNLPPQWVTELKTSIS